MTGLLLALLLVGPAAAEQGEQNGQAQAGFLTDLDVARDLARYEGRPVFVHFTAPWCEACKELRKNVYPRPEVAARLARFVRVTVDVETPRGKKAWMTYGLSGLPTLAFLRGSGFEVKSLRLVGLQEAGALVATLDRAITELEAPPPARRDEGRVAKGQETGPRTAANPDPLWVQSLWYIGIVLIMASIWLQYGRRKDE